MPYERDADPDDLPLPSVCFSVAAWQSCPHYLRLIQRKEIAQKLGLLPPDAPAESAAADEYGADAFEFREGDAGPGPAGRSGAGAAPCAACRPSCPISAALCPRSNSSWRARALTSWPSGSA